MKFSVKGGDNVVAAHFHCGRAGENGPVVVLLFSGGLGPLAFDGEKASGIITNAEVTPLEGGCGGQPLNNIASLAAAVQAG